MNKTMSSISLNELVDARIYAILREQQPDLVDAVQALVQAGETPAQIERQTYRRCLDRQMACYVRHIANHIQRTEAKLAQLQQPDAKRRKEAA